MVSPAFLSPSTSFLPSPLKTQEAKEEGGPKEALSY